MLNDKQEEENGPQYKIGELIFICDNEIMVVEDVQFIGSLYNGFGYDKSDPNHYDYLLIDKECNEYWYSHAQIEHKAKQTRI